MLAGRPRGVRNAAALDKVSRVTWPVPDRATPGHAKPYCDNFDERAQEDMPSLRLDHAWMLCGADSSFAANQHDGIHSILSSAIYLDPPSITDMYDPAGILPGLCSGGADWRGLPNVCVLDLTACVSVSQATCQSGAPYRTGSKLA